MSINGIYNKYDSNRLAFGYIDTIQRLRAVSPARNKAAISVHRDRSTHSMQHAMRMRKALEAVKSIWAKPEEIQVASPASATSASSLNLDMTVTATTIQSTEEVNTTPTSYSTHGPEWTGSTAQVTISGEYDGSNGTDTLTFKSAKAGTHGEDDLTIKVYDSNNDEIDKIDIKKNDPIDQGYTLDNGLVLTLGAGELIKHDTFTMEVDDAQPASFSPVQPDWAGSDALVTIGGVYDGSNGTDTLTFQVNRDGTHGEDDLQIKVYNSNNDQIDKFDIKKEDPIDKQYTLSNGLTFTLGEGDLLKDTPITIEVFDSIGTAVDPNKSFNGTRADDPNLEPGLNVSNGSFQINGITIDVNADDSLNSVLDRINQSDAGVTATFDVANETVLLTQKTPGSTSDIVLENDTSGFLAAVKLEGATATPGSSSEADNPLAQVESFHAVQSGNISVNGTSISIGVNTDSLNDVLDRINASGAGVKASFNSASQKVTLNSDNADSQMNLSDGATHFFSAVGISEGTYNSLNDLIQAEGIDVVNTPDRIVEFVKTFSTDNSDQEAETKSVTAPDGKMLGTLVKVIASSMNALFDDSSLTSSSTYKTEGIRNNIRSAISAWSDSEGPQYDTDFGIHFDFQKTKAGVFNFSEADQRRFENALTNPDSEAAVRNTLLGEESNGLFNQLHGALTAAIPDSDSNHGATGLFLDIVV